jgi:asparagine synthetase B (glutamine-hydrolysing)
MQFYRKARLYEQPGIHSKDLYFRENYLASINHEAYQDLFIYTLFAGDSNSALDIFGIESALKFDQDYYLPSDILFKTDRVSMFNSLEVRSPYLHPRILAYAEAIPTHLKVSRYETKLILREIYKRINNTPFPRRKKMGLGGPIDRWLEIGYINDQLVKGKEHEFIKETEQYFLEQEKAMIGM